MNCTNHFLIAMPRMADPNFFQSLILVCEHDDKGAFGFTINRAVNIPVQELFEQQNKSLEDDNKYYNQPIYLGGPVEQDHGFVLHSADKQWDSTLVVNDTFCISTSLEIFDAIAAGEGPDHSRFILGYTGWASGQLEAEIADNAWLTTASDPEIVFNLPDHEQWQAAATSMGVDLALINPDIGHA